MSELANPQLFEKSKCRGRASPPAYGALKPTLRSVARCTGEVQQQIDAMQQIEIFNLKQTIEETEAMGRNPLGDLAKQLLQELSERKIQLEITRHE